ncbi:MAG: hypothetical protein N3G20_10715, partial [Verrucomicrobiae bacterium]|nr:hypothetical protein [Verrucomicrobiae bacterium]
MAMTARELCVCAASPLVQSERLRRLARLPRQDFDSVLSFNIFSGFNILYDAVALRREAETVQGALGQSPDNIFLGVRLGTLYREMGKPGAANLVFGGVARALEQQGVESLADVKWLAVYGEALAGLGRGDDAERILRKSARPEVGEWRCHAALGRFLAEKARGEMILRDPLLISPEGNLAWLTDDQVLVRAGDRVKRAESYIREALSAFDCAIRIAPNEAELRAWRAAARSLERYVAGVAGGWGVDDRAACKRLAMLLPDEAVVDLLDAERLSATNARVTAISAIYLLVSSGRNSTAGTSAKLMLKELWGLAPEGVRAHVQEKIGRLRVLA